MSTNHPTRNSYTRICRVRFFTKSEYVKYTYLDTGQELYSDNRDFRQMNLDNPKF